MKVVDRVYVIHGTNVHARWLRVLAGYCPWWQPWSLFSRAIKSSSDSDVETVPFEWSGRNTHADRVKAGEALAKAIQSDASGGPRIHLVGHSHGGNVSLIAANRMPAGSITSIVLLATPNVRLVYPDESECDLQLESLACGGTLWHWLYWGRAAQNVERIWNLYSPQDKVQSVGARWRHGVPLKYAGNRTASIAVMQRFEDENSESVFNGCVPWKSRIAPEAHSAMHSKQVGAAIGLLITGRDFDIAMRAAGLSTTEQNPIPDAGCIQPQSYRPVQEELRRLASPAPYRLAGALPQKSRAVMDRPYNLELATVGALYERPQSVAGLSSKAGMLLVHGFTASATETRPLAEFIHAKTGWECRGVLLPGHGTTIEEMERTGIEDWRREVDDGYRRLAEDCSKVFLAGVSMGAVLCCLSALDNIEDQRIRGLILMAPPFGLNPVHVAGAHLLGRVKRYSWKGRETEKYFREKHLFSYTHVPLRKVREMAALGEEVFRKLDLLRRLPVLLLAGKRDQTVSLARIREAAGRHEWIRYIELPNSAHILTVEPDRETLFTETLTFMNALFSNP